MAKAGGRAKGTPNKKTQDLQEIADRLCCNPFEILCCIAEGNSEALCIVDENGRSKIIPLELRLHAAKEAAKYLYPQRKAVEVSNGDDTGFRVIIEDYQGGKK